MAGDADNAAGQGGARRRIARIFLADMDAVAAQFGGKIWPVVQDEGRAMGLHHRAQDVHRAADLVIADMLEAELERGHIAALERFLQKGLKKFAAESFGGEIR